MSRSALFAFSNLEIDAGIGGPHPPEDAVIVGSGDVFNDDTDASYVDWSAPGPADQVFVIGDTAPLDLDGTVSAVQIRMRAAKSGLNRDLIQLAIATDATFLKRLVLGFSLIEDPPDAEVLRDYSFLGRLVPINDVGDSGAEGEDPATGVVVLDTDFTLPTLIASGGQFLMSSGGGTADPGGHHLRITEFSVELLTDRGRTPLRGRQRGAGSTGSIPLRGRGTTPYGLRGRQESNR